jgi:hypothetical protein
MSAKRGITKVMRKTTVALPTRASRLLGRSARHERVPERLRIRQKLGEPLEGDLQHAALSPARTM